MDFGGVKIRNFTNVGLVYMEDVHGLRVAVGKVDDVDGKILSHN